MLDKDMTFVIFHDTRQSLFCVKQINMTSDIKVSEIMTKSVIVANVNNTFTQVMKFFIEYGIQHLPVAENDKLNRYNQRE
jgi:predicted transcriptional regulator